MNKHDYLNALKNALSGLGDDEIKKSLDFYSEIIADAVENGENEEDAVLRLGSVEETAQKIINETPLSKLVKENVKRRKLSGSQIALWVILSPFWVPLTAAAFAIFISLYFALWTVSASFFIMFAAALIVGLVLLFATPFLIAVNLPKALLSSGLGLMSAGASVFVFWIAVLSAKLIIRMTALIIRNIKKKVVSKGVKNNETI